jgi:hypothetical protein
MFELDLGLSVRIVSLSYLVNLRSLWIHHSLFYLAIVLLVFFISSTPILQMVNTRNCNNNNAMNGNAANPPPTLEKVLAMEAQ